MIFISCSPFSLYDGYLAVEIVDGSAVFSFNLAGPGANPVRVEINATKINTGHWYRLEAKLQPQVSLNYDLLLLLLLLLLLFVHVR
jgi:hypothetical protein